MRRSTRHIQRDTTMFLPGFEPDDVLVAAPATTVLASEVIQTVIAPVPTEVAMATAVVLEQVLPQAEPVLVQDLAVLDALAQDDETDTPLQFIQKRNWDAFALDALMPPSGEVERIERNIEVLRLVRQLRDSKQLPTAEQSEFLLTYTGWGAIARIFEEGLQGKRLEVHHNELRSLLTESEWNSARASTPNAHYTDPLIIKAMWEMARTLGFTGGRVIEPAAGTGLFIAGMPQDMAEQSDITAVEIDEVSAAVNSAVFAHRGVRTVVSGLEKAKLAHGFYDLAIGNIPFGNYRVPDLSKAPYANWSIHNWFIAKCIELVRPGGLVMLITSSFTMEGNEGVRKWLAAHAHLVDAIRLPQGAFNRIAKTDVVADVLILQRRKAPQFGTNEVWTHKEAMAGKEMLLSPDEKRYLNGREVELAAPINPWFAANPHRVLGKLQAVSGQYGKVTWAPVSKQTPEELGHRLLAIARSMPSGVYRAVVAEQPVLNDLRDRKLDALEATRIGQFVLHGDRLCISEGLTWLDVSDLYAGKLRERVLGMMRIRDAARAVIEFQSQSQDDAGLAQRQKALNMYYDTFVAKYGFIYDRMNVRAFRTDPDMPLLLSLEHYDAEQGVATKAAIFTQRTVNNREMPSKADSVKDALLISLAESGSINIRRMAVLCGKTRAQVRTELREQSLAFVDPVTGSWVTADEYLSGHIANKLAQAIAAGPAFAQNARALEAVQPAPLSIKDVRIKLGAPWVPAVVIEDFIAYMLQLARKPDDYAVSYDPTSASWSLRGIASRVNYMGSHELRSIKWGTPDRSFMELLEGVLNQQPPTITHEVLGRRVVDKARTLECREKAEQIALEFERWIHQDDQRIQLLLDTYNSVFNQIVPRKWNGQHLVLQGLSSHYVPYASQLDAAWRCMVGGNTLLAHCVGAGKSLTMMIASMEMRRLGIRKKPLHVVPSHMLYQYTGEFLKAFPNAKVLMADKESLSGDGRRLFAAKIATGDWDAVVMTHSSFERVPVRPERMRMFVDQVLDKIRTSLSIATDAGAKRSVKDLEKRLKDLQSRLEKQADTDKRDGLVFFDDLGIDQLFYDELHLAKNLMRISKMPRIAGLPNVSSQRSMDLLIKTQMLGENFGDKDMGLCGATATPIANTIAEMHTMMRFMIPKTLASLGIDEFDAWAATFGESVTSMEIAPDGSGFRMNTRFARFQNVPELMAIFKTCADVKTRRMLNLPTPEVEGGKPRAIVCSTSPELKAFTASLVERAEKVRGGAVEPKEDNMLKITHEGRLAAMDMRLVDPTVALLPDGKIDRVVTEVLRIHRETAHRKGTQVVFCDISTPKPVGFTVYAEIRKLLVERGVPDAEIAFVHDYDTDAQKDQLFRAVREGTVRVLLGTTSKMGVGTNIQTRLKAVHQIDSPWRPCDVEQRDGRGLRVGNEWESIELLRYVTEGSFDIYMWQGLEIKQRFIEQIMEGDSSIRSVEDLSTSSLTYAEIKALASGNPLVLEKANVDAEVLKLSTQKNLWLDGQWQLKQTMASLSSQVASFQTRLEHAPVIEAASRKVVATGFRLEHEVEQIRDACAGESCPAAVLSQAIGRALRFPREIERIPLGSVGEFHLKVVRYPYSASELLIEHVGARLTQAVPAKLYTPQEVRHVVLSVFENGQQYGEMVSSNIAMIEARIARCREQLAEPFAGEDRLQALRMRQTQIDAELDLDKDEAGTEAADVAETEAVA